MHINKEEKKRLKEEAVKRKEEKKRVKKVYKYSLSIQITCAFIAVLLLSLATCFLANNLLLEKYYIRNKEKNLIQIYEKLCSASESDELTSDDFGLILQKDSVKYNASIVIITSLFEPVIIYSNEPIENLNKELRSNLMGFSDPIEIIRADEDCFLVRQIDNYLKTEFIEMWGYLPSGVFFLMRTPVESIHESVVLANRFLCYVAAGAIVISGILILFLSKKISKPILSIADISGRMADMDFEAKYSGKEKNEIGFLGHNINYMSETLESKILELKKANVELERDIEQKEQIDEMRREFLGNVSHELKTPIALIQGYAEGLMEIADDEEERNYYCDVIIDEAGKMNKLVKQLLTLNQLETGNNNLNITRFDVVTLIRNYIQSSEIITKQKEIRVIFDEPEPIYVWADEFMIEEVFMNYFSNAINHCQSDVEKVIEVKVSLQDDVATVSVFNTGEHIPEESLDLIWDKFYKVDKARTREYGGSGVGLSIVKAILNYHRQEYKVTNCEMGVEFSFTLDAKK